MRISAHRRLAALNVVGHRQLRAGLRRGGITVAGSAMPFRSAVATCLAIFMPMFAAPLLAQAAACDQLFAGGQAPALRNVKLAQRTTALCNSVYAALASGVTRGPLWSADHLTADTLASAAGTPA